MFLSPFQYPLSSTLCVPLRLRTVGYRSAPTFISQRLVVSFARISWIPSYRLHSLSMKGFRHHVQRKGKTPWQARVSSWQGRTPSPSGGPRTDNSSGSGRMFMQERTRSDTFVGKKRNCRLRLSKKTTLELEFFFLVHFDFISNCHTKIVFMLFFTQ